MSTTSSAPASGVPSSQSATGPEAWAVLPAVQRALETPITPAAPLDTFTRGLAAHQDPSFLAPLTHGVEPMGGGLVDGLADLAPGSPLVRRDQTTLPVRPAAAPKAPASVQRSTWSWASTPEQSEELETVRWEHPSAPAAGEGVGMEVAGTGAPEAPLAPVTPTSPVAEQSPAAEYRVPERPVDRPVVQRAVQTVEPSRPSVDVKAGAPTAAGVTSIPSPPSVPGSAASGSVASGSAALGSAPVSEPVSASDVTPTQASPVSSGPTLAPLVVARAVAAPVVQRAIATDEPPVRELPVARSVETSPAPADSSPVAHQTAEDEAPLSGFAAAISTLQTPDPVSDVDSEPVATSADDTRATTEHVGVGHDVGPVVGGTGRSEAAATVQRLPELPVAGSRTARPEMSAAAEPTVALVGTRSLQSRYEELSSAVPPPPPVQRITYVPIQPASPGPAPSRPAPPVPAARHEPSVQRVPSPSLPLSAPAPETSIRPAEQRTVAESPAVPDSSAGWEAGAPDPASVLAPIEQEPDPGPAQPLADSWTLPTEYSGGPAAPPVAIVQRQRADDVPTFDDPGSAPVSFATMFADPSGQAGSTGSTTSASYAATHGHTSVALPTAGLPTMQRTESPAVQRLSLPGVPKLPSMPTVPSLPSAPSLPQVPDLPSAPDLPGAASGLADRAAGAASSAADSVGSAVDSARDAAGDAASSAVAAGSNAVQQATGAVAGAAAGAAGALGAAAGGADLDEMARRLFEPLSARLRAELWLDRERAGMVTDARL